MARKVLIGLLSLGAIGGFVGGFAQLHHYRHHGFGPSADFGHHGYEDHVAEVCTRAAERVLRDRPARNEAPRPEPPPPPSP